MASSNVIRQAVLDAIGTGSRVSDTIVLVSQQYPALQVRAAYWDLMADNQIIRLPSGQVQVAQQPLVDISPETYKVAYKAMRHKDRIEYVSFAEVAYTVNTVAPHIIKPYQEKIAQLEAQLAEAQACVRLLESAQDTLLAEATPHIVNDVLDEVSENLRQLDEFHSEANCLNFEAGIEQGLVIATRVVDKSRP